MHDHFQKWRSKASSSMTAEGITIKLNSPPAPDSIGEGMDEVVHRLPPYEERPAFDVLDYPGCPDEWTPQEGESTWFVPVIAEPPRHLWLDFNSVCGLTHEAAVVPSMQGVNALTATRAAKRLEQYRNNCPKHDVPFTGNLFCEKCGYEWPPQNYLATTGQRSGLMWLDGFRTEDGVVRGFLLTTETDRGIAAQVIGENRTHSIGLAIYLSKEPKPQRVYPTRRPEEMYLGGTLETFGATRGSKGILSRGVTSSVYKSADVEPVEIGAGAKIDQRVEKDPKDVDFWNEKPEVTFLIFYVPSQVAYDIIQQGKSDRTAGGEGPLQGLTTGNPKGPFTG